MLAEMITAPSWREEWNGRQSVTLLCSDFIYIMTVFHGTTKGSHLDAMEIFNVYKETKKGNPLNDTHTVGPSPISDVITQYIAQP